MKPTPDNINNKNPEEVYSSIRALIITAQNKVYSAINSAMVEAYWEIGKAMSQQTVEK